MWKFFELLLIPLITALLTGAVIWGSTRQQIDDLVAVRADSRITVLETQYSSMNQDVRDIKSDVKELLKRSND